jgi:hypothetical protein
MPNKYCIPFLTNLVSVKEETLKVRKKVEKEEENEI